MTMYRANSKVLGLKVGETFESSDPFYETFAAGGYISVVDQDEDADQPTDETDDEE